MFNSGPRREQGLVALGIAIVLALATVAAQDRNTLETKVTTEGNEITFKWSKKHPWDADLVARGAHLFADTAIAGGPSAANVCSRIVPRRRKRQDGRPRHLVLRAIQSSGSRSARSTSNCPRRWQQSRQVRCVSYCACRTAASFRFGRRRGEVTRQRAFRWSNGRAVPSHGVGCKASTVRYGP